MRWLTCAEESASAGTVEKAQGRFTVEKSVSDTHLVLSFGTFMTAFSNEAVRLAVGVTISMCEVRASAAAVVSCSRGWRWAVSARLNRSDMSAAYTCAANH